jgi:uncharacterized delta-60 repeat protein
LRSGDLYSSGEDLLVLPDGQLILEGNYSSEEDGVFSGLLSFAADGSPDAAFGGGTGVLELPADYDMAFALESPGGKVVVAALRHDSSPSHPPPTLSFFRFLSDGTPDQSFGSGGTLNTTIRVAFAHYGAVDPTGRVTVAINGPGPSSGFTASDFLVVRVSSDGSLDQSFADGGVASVAFPGAEYSAAGPLAVSPAGAVTVAGHGGGLGVSAGGFLVRLTPSGQPDPGYGSGGFVSEGVPPYVEALAEGDDGRLVAAASTSGSRLTDFWPTLFAFTATGAVDRGFAGDGKAELRKAEVGRFRDVAIQPDGKILAAGSGNELAGADESTSPGSDFLLARFRPNGAPDKSFARGGLVLVDLANGNYDSAKALGVQPSGRIVLAGSHNRSVFRQTYDQRLALIGIHPGNGRVDGDFDGVPDARDRCRNVPGPRNRGCPRIGRRISISWSDGKIQGRVRSSLRPCERAGSVAVVRREGRRVQSLGMADLDRKGRYSVDVKKRSGRVRARIRADLIPREGVCAAATSRALDLNR